MELIGPQLSGRADTFCYLVGLLWLLLVWVPFLIAVNGRRQTVRGSRLWWVYNDVVVTLRPYGRPSTLVALPFNVADDVMRNHTGIIWLEFVTAGIAWLLFGLGKDDDDGDGLGGRLKRFFSRSVRRPTPHPTS